MSIPKFIEIVDCGSIWHDSAILAGLVHKLLRIFWIAAKPAPLPAFEAALLVKLLANTHVRYVLRCKHVPHSAVKMFPTAFLGPGGYLACSCSAKDDQVVHRRKVAQSIRLRTQMCVPAGIHHDDITHMFVQAKQGRATQCELPTQTGHERNGLPHLSRRFRASTSSTSPASVAGFCTGVSLALETPTEEAVCRPVLSK